jgi:hypothetical protein
MLDRGLTDQGAADVLGWSINRVVARVKLLQLPERAQQMIGAGEIPLSAVDQLLSICRSRRRCWKRSSPTSAMATSGQPNDQQELANRGRWLLQSAIAEVARQVKSRALAGVVRGPEIRHKRPSGACRLRASAPDQSSTRGPSTLVPRWRRTPPTAGSRAAPIAQRRSPGEPAAGSTRHFPIHEEAEAALLRRPRSGRCNVRLMSAMMALQPAALSEARAIPPAARRERACHRSR